MSQHKCPTHNTDLIARPKARQTPEQLWCGDWFDCESCGYSELEQSTELSAFLNKQIESLKSQYQLLRGKRQREKFLKGRAPWVVEACRHP